MRGCIEILGKVENMLPAFPFCGFSLPTTKKKPATGKVLRQNSGISTQSPIEKFFCN